MNELFRRFARRVSSAAGAPWAFLLAVLVVVVWGTTGPMFGYSNTWQLVINTGTTIITFLMVFVIQNTQNRDSLAMHLKLDELIRAVKAARNGMVDLEDLSDAELRKLQHEFARLHRTEAERTARVAEGSAKRRQKPVRRRPGEIGEIGEHEERQRIPRAERLARARAAAEAAGIASPDEEGGAREERRDRSERRERPDRDRDRQRPRRERPDRPERAERADRPPRTATEMLDAGVENAAEEDSLEAAAETTTEAGASDRTDRGDRGDRKRKRRRRRGGRSRPAGEGGARSAEEGGESSGSSSGESMPAMESPRSVAPASEGTGEG